MVDNFVFLILEELWVLKVINTRYISRKLDYDKYKFKTLNWTYQLKIFNTQLQCVPYNKSKKLKINLRNKKKFF